MSKKNDILFELEWDGLDEFIKELDSITNDHINIIDKNMKRYGILLEEGTKSLVHHEFGDLSDSINFKTIKGWNRDVTLIGGSNSPYALRRHEERARLGIHDKNYKGDAFYIDGRGRGTRGKSAWRGYRPGRKFLSNAIKATEKDYDAMNSRILGEIMGDKNDTR